MRRRARLAVAALAIASAAGCGKHQKRSHHAEEEEEAKRSIHAHDEGLLPVDPWAKAPAAECERLPFAESVPVPEASGAAYLHEPAGDSLIVVGDSGTVGAYVEVGAEDGHLIRSGQLPLGDGAGDDVEGIAAAGGKLWGLTSAGWMRAWQRDGTGWKLVVGPYPVEKHGPCKKDAVNCGHDFEGVCVRPNLDADSAGCVGYAASRTDGGLYCLVRDGDQLVLERLEGWRAAQRGPKVSKRRALADCAIGADGAVWVGDNLLGGSLVRRLGSTPWEGSLGVGFPEAMALGPDGVVYRFSDTGTNPSLAVRYRCPAAWVDPAAPIITAAPDSVERDDRKASGG